MEFALVVPVFLLFLFGIIQYGTIFLVRNQMTEAASDAARTAVTYSDFSTASAKALSVLQQDIVNDGAGLMTENCSSAYVSCVVQAAPNCNAPEGLQCLQVLVTYAYTKDPVIDFPFLPAPTTITASSTVLVDTTASQ